MAIDFTGQVAIVTGAGRGLGRAHAIELARRGGAVVVNDVDQALADAVVEEIAQAGGTARSCAVSIATPEGGAALTEAALEHFGALHVLVNNAGITRHAYFEDLTLDDIDPVLDTHVRGAFFVTQPAWRVMVEHGYGRIVITSSSSGLFGHPALANYATAKAGLYGLTKALALEGRRHGIMVNALLPVAATKISADRPLPDKDRASAEFISGEERSALSARMDTAWVAPMVAFLASRECTITGEAFSACAGRYARVFVGVAEGWLAAGDDPPSSEVLEEHLGEIRDVARHSVPRWGFEEEHEVGARLLRSAD
jgi:NAD(P)-dependent dehydrogenase (short-subunit alcohol dehydrogenase family)